MRAVLCTVALLALAGQAFGILPLGDNGMTTYTGRKREPNTLVFGNQMVVDQGMQAVFDLTKQVLTGTWKATPNDPATEKKEVRVLLGLLVLRLVGWGGAVGVRGPVGQYSTRWQRVP